MAQSSLKDTTQITKLNSENYAIWKFKIQMLLMRDGLDDLLITPPPDKPDEAFLKRDKQARAIINLCIDDSQILHVRDETTTAGTWQKLKSVHERSNLSSKLYLLRKLYSIKMSEHGDMIEHISHMMDLVERLKAIGENIPDQHVAALLLVSIPESYNNLITALEARDETLITAHLVKMKLTDEYNRRLEQQADRNSNTSTAFKSAINARNYNNSNKRSEKFCSWCKRRGHTREFCFKLQNRNNAVSNAKPETRVTKYGGKSDRHCLIADSVKPHDFDEEQLLTPIEINMPTPIEINMPTPCEKSFIITSKYCFERTSINKRIFYLDSGASSHLITDECLFTGIEHNISSAQIILADGKVVFSKGIGCVDLDLTDEYGSQKVRLTDAYFVPDLKCNLISVKKITSSGYSVLFEKEHCFVKKNDEIILHAYSDKDSLYKIVLNKETENANVAVECKNKNCIQIWHSRLGHRSYDAIKQLVREDLAEGIKLDNCVHNNTCSECIKNKMQQIPYPKTANVRANKPLQLIHSDICGPLPTPSIGGKHYFVTFIDDFTRYTVIYLLAKKDEVLSKLKEFVGITRNKFGRTIQTLRTDNGGEYTSKEMEDFLSSNGIKHQLSVPYSPPQNGVSERKNRSLTEMTRCLLSQCGLPNKFWAEAVNTANYIQNRLPTKACEKTPYELWSGRKPSLAHMRQFGCKAYAYIHKENRRKLDQKASEGTFVGYDQRSKGYRIYTGNNRVIVSRSVKFVEEPPINENVEIASHPNVEIDKNDEETEDRPQIPSEKEPRRSERRTKGQPPERFGFLANAKMNVPENFSDLNDLDPEEKEKWLLGINEEINSLSQNETWELVDLPVGKKPIGCRWIFKLKRNEDGTVARHKARLVAKGYSQKFGTDYDHTFAPVVRHTTIRTFLAAAAYSKMHVKHADVTTAFLHGHLEEEIYMEQPDGTIKAGQEQKVCRLKKSLYGLKQAARAWNKRIEEVLKNEDFSQSTADPCLFLKKDGTETIMVTVYVDDILIACKNEEKIEKLIKHLNKFFEVKNLGEIRNYLGMNIQRDGNKFLLSQRSKIEELKKKFCPDTNKPSHTPMDTSYLKEEDTSPPFDNSKYRQAIGSLLYIATVTRPDITLAVNLLSRKNESPSEKDWTAVLRVIEYLNHTKDSYLNIDSDSPPILTCYTDADYASDLTTRRSTGGNLFFLGNSPIFWSTKRQNCVSLSSTESELISAAAAAQELKWILNLLEDFGLCQKLPINMFEDNKSTISLIQHGKMNTRLKHINVKYFFLREMEENKIIKLVYCNTNCMIADILTKPLPKPKFTDLRNKLNLILAFPETHD